MNTQEIGQLGEGKAQQYLEKQGLSLVLKNYRCPPGEIDLIMQDGHHLVFVEVRLRSYADFSSSLESITPAKQHRIILAATHYLQETRQWEKIDCRFDVLGIDQNAEISWIKNAFQVE